MAAPRSNLSKGGEITGRRMPAGADRRGLSFCPPIVYRSRLQAGQEAPQSDLSFHGWFGSLTNDGPLGAVRFGQSVDMK
jgi:hypothetical protein